VPDAPPPDTNAELVAYLQRVSDEELDALEAATTGWHEEGRPLTAGVCRTILAQWKLGEEGLGGRRSAPARRRPHPIG
jgi:hypothetical protein